MRAGAHGDAVIVGENFRRLAGIHVADVERDDRRAVLREVAVHRDARQGGYLIIKSAHKRGLVRVDGGGGDFVQKIHRRGQPRDAVAVERAALEPRRIFLRLLAPVGLHARAAGLERADFHAGCGDEPAGPLRPHHALMPGEAEDGNAVALRVQVKAARRLRGVEDEQKAVLARKSADARYVQRVAGEIGGVCADDGACVRT